MLHSKNVQFQLSKCRFCQVAVPYVGHLLSGTQLQQNPKTIAAIINVPIPHTAQQLNSILGLVGWYSDFILDLATKAKPLRALSRKGATLTWDTTCQGAFEGNQMRNLRQAGPGPLRPQCDHIPHHRRLRGGNLCHLDPDPGGKEVLVTCASHTLQPAERNYTTVEQEALACIWGIEKFERYLWGQHFTL